MPYAFGNDPAKIERYRAFWLRSDVSRPLTGFSFAGWFPLGEFSACRPWLDSEFLTPEMIDPAALIDDHLRMMSEGERMDDDLIRGACPGQVAIPWIPAMIGSRLRILPENILGEEHRLCWDDALALRLESGNPWLRKYLEYAAALAGAAGGRFPVSHSPELGPTDLHAVLRGHTESVMDLTDEPDRSRLLLEVCGDIFRKVTEELWRTVPLFHGGWFDAQYSLWAPGAIVRLQEDATAVYSPSLYRRFVQPVDREIAARFPSSFIHLHSTSMFLLDAILEIEEIRCFEINQDVLGPPPERMVRYFRRVQDAGRPLLIRGSFTPDELRLLMDSLDPRGLMLLVMVKSMDEVETLRPVVGM